MTARAPSFKKADIKRAVSAVQEAGLQVCGVAIDPTGTITITTYGQAGKQALPYDEWMHDNAHST